MPQTFNVETKADVVTDAINNTNCNVLTAGGSATLVIIGALISNKTVVSANVDLYLVTNTGDDVYLVRNAPVPAGSSLEVISGSKIIIGSKWCFTCSLWCSNNAWF